MVEATKVADRIESWISAVDAELSDLPQLVLEWDELTEDNRLTYALEWDDIVGQIRLLDRSCRTAQMTPDQEARYGALLAKLKDVQPIIERLKLHGPPVSLEG